MKKSLMLLLSAITLFAGSLSAQQDKSKRPSPPATASETTVNGNVITIDYSQPSVKGRTIGKDIAPFDKVWRTGANEATTFTITKDSKIEGKPLPAGKYSLYSIPGEANWIIIFNKAWDQWGTVYNQSEDALRVTVAPAKSASFTEKMTFSISKKGLVTLLWGDTSVSFTVK